MVAQEVPRFPNVFLPLLEGHLFSNGIGLISHLVVWIPLGIYGRSWGSFRVWRFLLLADLEGLLWVVMKISGIFLIIFFWGNDASFQWNALAGIAYGISMVGFLYQVVCGSGVL